jgi:thioredoxin reductase
VRNQVTGILSDGDMGYEFSKLVYNLTKDLFLFSNGESVISKDQKSKLAQNNINLVEDKIEKIEQENGNIRKIIFKSGKEISLKALYAKIPFEQNINASGDLGCELSEYGFIKIDSMHKTNIPGVFACGDNVTMMRSVANAVAQGNFTGAIVNKELTEESF